MAAQLFSALPLAPSLPIINPLFFCEHSFCRHSATVATVLAVTVGYLLFTDVVTLAGLVRLLLQTTDVTTLVLRVGSLPLSSQHLAMSVWVCVRVRALAYLCKEKSHYRVVERENSAA